MSFLRPLHIDVRGDRITVRARQVPLEDALAAIASRLGAEVRGHVAGPRTVDVEFEDVALPDGFARLLGRESFALVYGGAGTVPRIHLLGGPHDIGAAHADVASAAIAAPAPADLPSRRHPAGWAGPPRQWPAHIPCTGPASLALRRLGQRINVGVHREARESRRKVVVRP